MQNLLSEGVSIRNLPLILEAVADAAKLTTNLETLSEYVRSGIARQISNALQGFDGKLRVLTLNPELEESLREALQETDLGNYLALNPDLNSSFVYAVNEENRRCAGMGYPAILLVAPELRKPVRRVLERDLRGVTVLSYNEIVADVELEAVGMVSIN